jgi:hypothetical protein
VLTAVTCIVVVFLAFAVLIGGGVWCWLEDQDR